ncbi:MAG TPA: hypothetical protein VG435_05465 [Acidimicrobiales bacterium]|jgi:hypothetical protein|nr:hypothetical protein [Acidimicrobiales bacterium]
MTTSSGRIRRLAGAGALVAAVGAGAFVTLAPLSGHGSSSAATARPAVADAPASVQFGGKGPDPYLLCIAYGKTYGICLVPAPT